MEVHHGSFYAFSPKGSVRKQGFFHPQGHTTPRKNAVALQKGHFTIIGRLMAMSIVQDSPAPAFLNHAIVQYLCGQTIVPEIKHSKWNNSQKDGKG